MKLLPSQRKCFDDVLKKYPDLDQKVKWLEEVAKNAPDYQERVNELRDLLDHIHALASACLAAGDPIPA